MAFGTPQAEKPWPPPNFVNPENMHPLILGPTVALFILAILFFVIRIYARSVLKQNMGWDDFIMLLAVMLAIPMNVAALVSLNLGLGLHVWDQKPEWHMPYSKLGYTADLLFTSACSLTKVSLCLTYLRLFPNRSTKLFCYVMTAFIGVFTLSCVFLSVFQCRPIRAYWDTTVEQVCINMHATFISVAGLNSFSDFCIYLWPVMPLWSLQLPLKQRLGLIFLFSVGLHVCIAGVLRMYFLEVYFGSFDTSWNAGKIWTIMCAEMNMGVVCACVSSVRPVMQALFPSIFGSTNRYGSGRTGPAADDSDAPDSHHFQTLPNKLQDKSLKRITSVEKFCRFGRISDCNFTWTSSDGHDEDGLGTAPHVVEVEQIVSVQEVKPGVSRISTREELSDDGSEEWILYDRPPRIKQPGL